MRVPTEAEWGNYLSDLDQAHAYIVFGGHTNQEIRMSDVLFRIKVFARRKNDYSLAPFATDDEGLATITKAQLKSEVAADHDSGVMDKLH